MGESLEEQIKQIVKHRPFPRDRMEAALFGYSEEEWQQLIKFSRREV